MYDNPCEIRVGWSFLDDERSRFEVDGQWWMYERMFKEQKLREHFLGADPAEPFKKGRAAEYQDSIDRFRELLLFLIHVSSQPPCTPELLGLRWKNSNQGGVRNIIIENGMVGCVAAYHKGYRNSGSIKIIHRYLPERLESCWCIIYGWCCHSTKDYSSKPRRNTSAVAFLWGDGEKIEHRQWTGPRRRPGTEEEEGASGSRESTPRSDTEAISPAGRVKSKQPQQR